MNLKKNIQTEVDASFLYGVLADHEENADVAEIFRQMSEIEKSHALAFLCKHNLPETPFPVPSLRARILVWIGKVLGFDYVLGVLMDTEKGLSRTIVQTRKNFDQKHLPYLIQHMLPSLKIYSKHRLRYQELIWLGLKKGTDL